MKLQQKNAENFTFPAAPRCDPGCHPHLQDPKSILCLPHIPQCFLNERAWLCCPEEEEEENTNTSACCHRNPGQLMRHQLQNKSFSVFAALGFFSPSYNQMVSLPSVCQPSQKLGSKTEPLKKAELCGLRSVNGQEEGRRKLVPIQGGGWKRSCAIPGGSGKRSHCFVGKTQPGELRFPSYLLGLRLKMAI